MPDRVATSAGSVDEPFGVSPARVEAASLLRRLGHAFVGGDAPDELFVELCEAVGPFVARLEGGPVRNRSLMSLSGVAGSSLFGEPPGDGERLSHFPDCVVSGTANPMGTAIAVRREADDAVAEVVLPPCMTGHLPSLAISAAPSLAVPSSDFGVVINRRTGTSRRPPDRIGQL